MSLERAAWSIVCDDIRQEVGNKHSYMGIYGSDMFFQQFPVTVPKLCMVISARTPVSAPFKALSFRVLKDESEILGSADVDMATIPKGDTVSAEVYIAQISLVFSPINFDGPCKLSVRVITESEELKAGAVRIRAVDTVSSKQG